MVTKHRTVCDVADCPNKHFARGYCAKHYHRWQRHGDPSVTFPSRGGTNRVITGRRTWLKTRYGLTVKDYDDMFAAQGGICAICGTDQPGGRAGRFHVDHCHRTGRVRGLLCSKCNFGLGAFDDVAGRLENAIAYLR